MARLLFSLSFGLLSVRHVAAARVGDRDYDPKEQGTRLAENMVDRFGNEEEFSKDRKVLADIRQTEIQGGSSGADRKYLYLGTECLQQRLHWAAKAFKKQGCKRILEVGGFHTPLAMVIDGKDMPQNLQLYADVDPSANESRVEDFNENFASVTLQIILDEFRSKEKSQKKHFGKLFDCFLMLGTTAQNVGTEDKKQALQDALSGAKMAIIEFPSSNPDTPGHLTKPVQAAGMKEKERHVVQCKDDPEAIKVKGEGCGENNSCLTRNMLVYTRNKEEKKEQKKADAKK